MTYHLSVPVLRHKVFKPSYSCISAIRAYFSSLPAPIQDEELIVVGDRIFTDIVLANRMSRRRTLSPPQDPDTSDEKSADERDGGRLGGSGKGKGRVGPLSVWTNGVWEKESMVMRALEKGLMRAVERYVVPDNGVYAPGDMSKFVKKLVVLPAPVEKEGVFRRLLHLVRRDG